MRAVGTEVGFDFYLARVSLSDPLHRRTGRGVIVDDRNYSVWPSPGYTLRVTESPDYTPGTHIAITSLSVRR